MEKKRWRQTLKDIPTMHHKGSVWVKDTLFLLSETLQMSRRTHLARQMREVKEAFVYKLYMENCEEKRNWGEKIYTLSEYEETNREFIEKRWQKYHERTFA